ncbi:Hypothetical predicted protein [Cloeon dipterum]|uniref:Uncharacterized protein n=1 Tax=Cloeon dipterum TaxID=197152 RepID=A0A8S1DS73_9INSE|nr:Hypothetical predicted protein [Cloeon dipterum]
MMAATRNSLIFLVLVCVACPALSKNPRRISSEVELIEAKNVTIGKNASGDFTITRNPALDTTLVTTAGDLLSTIIKAIFGGDDKSSREGGGFMSVVKKILCKIVSIDSLCSSGTDFKDVPVNITYGQLKEVENKIRKVLPFD